MSDNSIKGLLLFVAGGIVLYALQGLYDQYTERKSEIIWGFYEPFSRTTPEIADKIIALRIENNGNSTANQVELFLEKRPTLVFLDSVPPHRLEERDNSFVVVFSSIAPDSSQELLLDGLEKREISTLVSGGEVIAPTPLQKPDFGNQTGSFLQYALFITGVMLLGFMSYRNGVKSGALEFEKQEFEKMVVELRNEKARMASKQAVSQMVESDEEQK